MHSSGPRTRDLPVLTLTLISRVFMASRKLKQYFLGHPVTVVSSAPLGDIIQNREATGRVAKWAIELGPHGLKYMPRTAI